MLPLLISIILSAYQLMTTTTQASGTRETLKKLENTIAGAVVRRNISSLDTLYADDFVFTHGTGQVQNKNEWLDIVQKSNFIAREIDSQAVESHGDVAITTGRLTIKYRDKEEIWVIYVRVYRFSNDRWQMLSHRTVDASYRHQ